MFLNFTMFLNCLENDFNLFLCQYFLYVGLYVYNKILTNVTLFNLLVVIGSETFIKLCYRIDSILPSPTMTWYLSISSQFF